MYVIESELRQQFDALARTVQALTDQQGEAKEALDGIRTLCVLGCGSSFSLAKSAATLFSQHTGVPAYALPAGDVLVNFESYKKLLAGCTLLLLSRSSSTSEVLRAATRCKQELGCKVLSVCAREDAPVEGLSHWNLRLPWAFDEAVCQTRTVSNLYVAVLGLAYIAAGESESLAELRELTVHASTFCPAQEETLSALAQGAWTKAVVLGDSGMAGLMEEGALAAVKPADTPFLNRVRSLPGARLCHITPDNREELYLRLRPEVV